MRIDKQAVYRVVYGPTTLIYWETHHDIPLPSGCKVDWVPSRQAIRKCQVFVWLYRSWEPVISLQISGPFELYPLSRTLRKSLSFIALYGSRGDHSHSPEDWRTSEKDPWRYSNWSRLKRSYLGYSHEMEARHTNIAHPLRSFGPFCSSSTEVPRLGQFCIRTVGPGMAPCPSDTLQAHLQQKVITALGYRNYSPSLSDSMGYVAVPQQPPARKGRDPWFSPALCFRPTHWRRTDHWMFWHDTPVQTLDLFQQPIQAQKSYSTE